jgi:NAD-dependent deacetylase
MRPDIVWFGEPLPQNAWEPARSAADRADVILVVGTSAVVYPAAALAMGERAFVAEINPENTAISDRVDCVVRAKAAQALPNLINLL